MLAKSFVAVAILAGSAAAQTNASYIDPSTVDAATKASWCTGQQQVCTVLCDNDPETNRCTATTLTYDCLCQNGTAPGLQYYMNSLPYRICEKSADLCVEAATNDILKLDNCTTNIRDECGTLDIANYTAVSSSAASSTAASATSTGGSSAATTTSAGAASTTSASSAATNLLAQCSVGVVAAGLATVFGLLL